MCLKRKQDLKKSLLATSQRVSSPCRPGVSRQRDNDTIMSVHPNAGRPARPGPGGGVKLVLIHESSSIVSVRTCGRWHRATEGPCSDAARGLPAERGTGPAFVGAEDLRIGGAGHWLSVGFSTFKLVYRRAGGPAEVQVSGLHVFDPFRAHLKAWLGAPRPSLGGWGAPQVPARKAFERAAAAPGK